MLSFSSVWLSGGWKSMIRPRRAEVARGDGRHRLRGLDHVDAVLALVVGDERDPRAVALVQHDR